MKRKRPRDTNQLAKFIVDIATGDGVLRLLELQRAGGKRQPVSVFIQGYEYKQ